MTDHDRPDDVNRTDPADPADVAWFRRTMAPVVEAEPVGEAWEAIATRATGDSPGTVLSPTPSRHGNPTRRHLTLAAATIVTAVAIGAALIALRVDDDASEVVVPATPGAETDEAGRGTENQVGTTTVIDPSPDAPPVSAPVRTSEQVLGNGLVAIAEWPAALPADSPSGLVVRVTFTNPTDQDREVTGCRWGLQRIGYPLDPASAHQAGCDRAMVVAAGTSIPHTLTFPLGDHATPGRYHAVYESDREEVFRGEVVVLTNTTSRPPSGLGEELQDLARRAVGGLDPTIPDHTFAPTVRLGVGPVPTGELDRADLADPDLVVAATSLDGTELDHYAGRVSPFSVWDLLALPGPVSTSEGVPANCFGTGTHPAPPTEAGQRVVSLTRIGVDSCLNWYAVAVVVDAEDHIVALHLYHEEP